MSSSSTCKFNVSLMQSLCFFFLNPEVGLRREKKCVCVPVECTVEACMKAAFQWLHRENSVAFHIELEHNSVLLL